jgi:hypothetical protein
MAQVPEAPAPLESDGPEQHGRSSKGQYVYWITMAHPLPETVAAHNLLTPAEFTRTTFRELVVEAHAAGLDPSPEQWKAQGDEGNHQLG